MSGLLTRHALNSPEVVEEAGDVGEEGAVVVGPALGSQIATGPRKSPNQARSRAFGKRKAARARHRGSPG
jgi:hypothetical protein